MAYLEADREEIRAAVNVGYDLLDAQNGVTFTVGHGAVTSQLVSEVFRDALDEYGVARGGDVQETVARLADTVYPVTAIEYRARLQLGVVEVSQTSYEVSWKDLPHVDT